MTSPNATTTNTAKATVRMIATARIFHHGRHSSMS
jgi:hypothetical protein